MTVPLLGSFEPFRPQAWLKEAQAPLLAMLSTDIQAYFAGMVFPTDHDRNKPGVRKTTNEKVQGLENYAFFPSSTQVLISFLRWKLEMSGFFVYIYTLLKVDLTQPLVFEHLKFQQSEIEGSCKGL